MAVTPTLPPNSKCPELSFFQSLVTAGLDSGSAKSSTVALRFGTPLDLGALSSTAASTGGSPGVFSVPAFLRLVDLAVDGSTSGVCDERLRVTRREGVSA